MRLKYQHFKVKHDVNLVLYLMKYKKKRLEFTTTYFREQPKVKQMIMLKKLKNNH